MRSKFGGIPIEEEPVSQFGGIAVRELPVSQFGGVPVTDPNRPERMMPTPRPVEEKPVRKKGLGYFGELERPDGDISTELSVGVEFDDEEMEIPLLVPTLTEDEVKHLLSGEKETEEILNKAVEHAKLRMGEGKNPFADEADFPAKQKGFKKSSVDISTGEVTRSEPIFETAKVTVTAKKPKLSPKDTRKHEWLQGIMDVSGNDTITRELRSDPKERKYDWDTVYDELGYEGIIESKTELEKVDTSKFKSQEEVDEYNKKVVELNEKLTQMESINLQDLLQNNLNEDNPYHAFHVIQQIKENAPEEKEGVMSPEELGAMPQVALREGWKDVIDALRLSVSDMTHKTKNYFLSTYPNDRYRNVEMPKRDKEYEQKLIDQGIWDENSYEDLKKEVVKLNEINAEKRANYKEKYVESQKEYKTWLANNKQLQPPNIWKEGVIKTIKDDPKVLLDRQYWAFVASQSIAFTLGVVGTTMAVTKVTGNPMAGLVAGVAVATPFQSQDLYEDLIENGATEEQASKLSVPIGSIIAMVEVAGDLPFLRSISPAFSKLLTRNMKREVAKRTMAEFAKKGLKTFTAIEIGETLEEIVQGAIQDATVRTVNENRDILKDIPETVVQTLMATAPLALFGGSSDIARQYKKSMPDIFPVETEGLETQTLAGDGTFTQRVNIAPDFEEGIDTRESKEVTEEVVEPIETKEAEEGETKKELTTEEKRINKVEAFKKKFNEEADTDFDEMTVDETHVFGKREDGTEITSKNMTEEEKKFVIENEQRIMDEMLESDMVADESNISAYMIGRDRIKLLQETKSEDTIFDGKQTDMDSKELTKAGFDQSAMGFGGSAQVWYIDGKPAVAWNWENHSLSGVSVHPDFRRKGVAKALVNWMIDNYGTDGSLRVADANEPMIKVLESIGAVDQSEINSGYVTVTRDKTGKVEELSKKIEEVDKAIETDLEQAEVLMTKLHEDFTKEQLATPEHKALMTKLEGAKDGSTKKETSEKDDRKIDEEEIGRSKEEEKGKKTTELRPDQEKDKNKKDAEENAKQTEIKEEKEVLDKGDADLSVEELEEKLGIKPTKKGIKIIRKIGSIQSKAPNAVKIVYFNTQEDYLNTYPEERKRIGKNSILDGVYDPATDQVFLVLENIESLEHAVATWVHEQGIHVGLRYLFKDKELLNEALMNVYNSIGLDKIIKTIGLSYHAEFVAGRMTEVEIAEEYIAHIAEMIINEETLSKIERSAWDSFVDMVRKIIDKIVGKNALTEKNIEGLIYASVKTLSIDTKAEKKKPTEKKKPAEAKKHKIRNEQFYSQFEKVVDEKFPKTMKQQSVKNWLKKQNVKELEMDTMGLDEWLEGKKVITLEELKEFVALNQIELEEVVLGGKTVEFSVSDDQFEHVDLDPDAEGLEDAFSWYIPDFLKDDVEYVNVELFEDGTKEINIDGNVVFSGKTGWSGVRQYIEQYMRTNFNVQDKVGTKYSDYQLSGGENYREVLLAIPTKEKQYKELKKLPEDHTLIHDSSNNTWGVVPKSQAHGRSITGFYYDTKEEAIKHALATLNFRERAKTRTTGFKSAHFEEPNIVVHIRMNDRTDLEDKKVLFIEEIQSDWATRGKKEGFISDKLFKEEDLNAKIITSLEDVSPEKKHGVASIVEGYINDLYEIGHDSVKDVPVKKRYSNTDRLYSTPTEEYVESYLGKYPLWTAKMPNGQRYFFPHFGELKTGKKITYDQWLKRHLEDANKEIMEKTSAVPDMPFKNNEYMKLALKKVLAMAIEQGYDKIAWTTGEQQTNRYDLSKRVDTITSAKLPNGKYMVNVSKNGNLVAEYEIEENKLANFVGKDLAEKIVNDETVQQGYTKDYSGVDLKIGGKGMRVFYDEKIAGFLKKYIKQWQGKVGETNFKEGMGFRLWKKGSSYVGERYLGEFKGAYINVNVDGGREVVVPDDYKTPKQVAKELGYDIKDLDIVYDGRAGDPSVQQSVEITPQMKQAVSQGQPMYKRRTDTEAFKNWFGDSKVVDNNSDPLVVHHGGAEEITVFDEGFAGTTTGDNEYGAFYFSNEKDVGEDYSRQAFIRRYQDYPEGLVDDKIISQKEYDELEDDGVDWYEHVDELAEERIRTVDAYLKMETPLIADAEHQNLREFEKTFNIQEMIGFIKGEAKGFPENLYDELKYNKDDLEDYKEEINEYILENYDIENIEDAKDWMINEARVEVLEEQRGIFQEIPEYDGIIIKNVIDDIGQGSSVYQDVYIVTDPNQIKSVYNEGGFSPYISDIRYKKRKTNWREALEKERQSRRLDVISLIQPEEGTPPIEEKDVRVTQEWLGEALNEMEMELSQSQKITVEEMYEQAKATGKNPDDLVDKTLETGEPVSDQEVVLLFKPFADLMRQQDALVKQLYESTTKKEQKRITKEMGKVRAKIEKYANAIRIKSSSAGRTLQSFKTLIDKTDLTFSNMQRRVEETLGRKLTPLEIQQISEITEEYGILKAQYEKMKKDYTTRLEEEVQKEIEKRIADQKKKKTPKTKAERLVGKRTTILGKLAGMGESVLYDIIGMTVEKAKLLSQLAMIEVELGADTFQEVIDRMVKKVPSLSREEIIYGISNRAKKSERKIASEERKKMRDFRRIATALVDLENLHKHGRVIIEPKEKTPDTQSAYLKKLTEQIAKEKAKLKKIAQLAMRSTSNDKERIAIQKKIDLIHQRISEKEVELKNAEQGIFVAKQLKKEVPIQLRELRKVLREINNELAKLKRAEKKKKRTKEDERKSLEERKKRTEEKIANIKEYEGKEVDPFAVENLDIKKELKDLKRVLDLKRRKEKINHAIKTGDYSYLEDTGQELAEFNEEIVDARYEMNKAKKKAYTYIDHKRGFWHPKVILQELFQLTRTIMASGDFMPIMRQGTLAVSSHPKMLAEIVAEQFKTGFSEKQEMKAWAKIEESPFFMEALYAGVDFYDINSTSFEDRPEFFRSRLLDTKYTAKGLGLGLIKEVSERWFVSYINAIAIRRFEMYMLANPTADAQEKHRFAQYLNALIGKGDFGKFRAINKPLAFIGFAPRYELSKWQLPYHMVKGLIDMKSMRKDILRDFFGFVISRLLYSKVLWGVWIIHMLGGKEPDDDPRSADWEKQVVGNIHADDWGAYLQIARLFSKMIRTGKFIEPSEKEKAMFTELFSRYMSYRMNPNISLGIELYTGRSIVGFEISAGEALAESFTPMAMRDIYEMLRDEESGTLADIFFGTKAMIGGNVQVYETRNKIEEELGGRPIRPARPVRELEDSGRPIRELD